MVNNAEKFLGRTVNDRITGFNGVVTGYVQYLTGCNQCLVSPPVGPNNEARDGLWIDEQRLVVDYGTPSVVLDNGRTPGFDKAPPVR